jgi:hypothetical protein
MNLTGIIAVSGITGLSKVVAKTKNGIVCESLADKKRFPVQGSDKISALEDISVYTEEGEKPLKEIFASIKSTEEGKQVPVDLKGDPKKLREYFTKIVPNFDQERVYNSDIKKLLGWYNILLSADLLVEEVKETSPEPKEKPVKKSAAKKEKKSEPKVSDDLKEKKTVKKAPAKKAKKTEE